MAARRTVILVAAIVVAALAAVATYGYLSSAQERANGNAKLVKVFKVARDVQKGVPGEQAIEQGFIKPDKINAAYRPATAITDVNVLRGKVALTNLAANQVVVDGQFVDPKVATVSSAQRIPTGNVAVSVQVDQVRGVAGLVQPGDKVNIMIKNKDGSEQFLFQNVKVLFVGSQAAPQPGETTTASTVAPQGQQTGGLLTFAVPPEAAVKIGLAVTQSLDIYLNLVPPDYQPVPVPPVSVDNVARGGLTP